MTLKNISKLFKPHQNNKIPERRIEALLSLLQLDWSLGQIPHVLSLVKEPGLIATQRVLNAMATTLERKALFYFIKNINQKSAEDVMRATIELLMPYNAHVLTILRIIAESLRTMKRQQTHQLLRCILRILIVLVNNKQLKKYAKKPVIAD